MRISIQQILNTKNAIPIESKLFAPARPLRNCTYPNLKSLTQDSVPKLLYLIATQFMKIGGLFYV